MCDHRGSEGACFSQKDLFTSARAAVGLPLLFLVFFLACGGGSNSVEQTTVSDASAVPEIDEPVVSEFILGVGDELVVRVWQHEDLNRRLRLDASGEFYYPFVGYTNADGLSLKEVRQIIHDGLSRYYVNPQVGVEVLSMRSLKTFVLGEVAKPGVFVLGGAERAIELISKAGDFTDDAKKSSVILIRGDLDDPYLQRLNMEDFLVKGDVSQNILLEPGDVLYVPKSFIADIRTFFNTARIVIRPIVDLERAIIFAPRVEDVLFGEETDPIGLQ